MRGLLRLVEIVAKIKASNQLRKKEELRCPSEPSPPADLSTNRESVAVLAAREAAAPDHCLEPHAGESSECSVRTGGQP